MSANQSKRNRILLLGGIVAAVLAAAILVWRLSSPSDGFSPDGPHLVRVRIGYQPLASNLPVYVALQQGFFRSHGLDVELVRFETADTAADAVLRGDVLTDFSLPFMVVLLREAAAPGSFLAYGFQLDTPERSHEALIVPTASTIATLSDLGNKSVGVFPGVAARAYLVEALAAVGVPRDAVDARPLQVQLHLQSLRSGQIDALLGFEPAVTIATREGFARIIEWGVYPRHIQNPFPVTMFVFNRAHCQSHSRECDAIVAAIRDAIAYIQRSPREANRSVVGYTAVTDPAVAEALNQPVNVLAQDVETSVLQRAVDWHQQVGLLNTQFSITSILYTSAPPPARGWRK